VRWRNAARFGIARLLKAAVQGGEGGFAEASHPVIKLARGLLDKKP